MNTTRPPQRPPASQVAATTGPLPRQRKTPGSRASSEAYRGPPWKAEASTSTAAATTTTATRARTSRESWPPSCWTSGVRTRPSRRGSRQVLSRRSTRTTTTIQRLVLKDRKSGQFLAPARPSLRSHSTATPSSHLRVVSATLVASKNQTSLASIFRTLPRLFCKSGPN